MPTIDDVPIMPVLTSLSLSDKLIVSRSGVSRDASAAITVGDLLVLAIGALPTTEPATVGDLWLNSGVLTRKMS